MKKVKDFYINGKDGEIYTISIYCDEERYVELHALVESKQNSIGRGYGIRKDPPHTSKNQYHLHFFDKNGQLFAINKDGTAHDKSHGYQMPQYIQQYMSEYLPDYKIPKNGIVESCAPTLLENINAILGENHLTPSK